jgi:hypothetical protein
MFCALGRDKGALVLVASVGKAPISRSKIAAREVGAAGDSSHQSCEIVTVDRARALCPAGRQVARELRLQSTSATIGNYDARCLDQRPADRRDFRRSAREPAPHETGQHFDRQAVRH